MYRIMRVLIKLLGHSSNNKCPWVEIRINGQSFYSGVIKDEKDISIDFSPLPKNMLEIEHIGKENSDTIVGKGGNIIEDLAVELRAIFLDDVEIKDTTLYNSPYYVNWPSNLVEESTEPLPEFITNNLFFGFNGIYKMEFSDSVIFEYFNQFWIDEEQAHINQTISDSDGDYFSRFDEKTPINEDATFTIYDLEKRVLS